MSRRSTSTDEPPPGGEALRYTNRKGGTYYLHKGRTKTGKPRYFVAKSVRQGALPEMPDGYEFSESINGVVSVRRVRAGAPKIPERELAMAQAELARHEHLRRHRVEVVNGEIVVFEPRGASSFNGMGTLARKLGVSPELFVGRAEGDERRTSFDPVMKFVPTGEPGVYTVHRMTYRGEGGWSWPLGEGKLKRLLRRFLGKIGTEEFFELF